MTIKLKPLHDQVLVITGASSGIGLATAQGAVAAGARVVLVARNEPALEEVERQLAAGERVLHVVADVGKREDVERVARETVQRFGGFDTWINNAGAAVWGRFEDIDNADHQRVMQTNFWGTLYGTQVALAHLKRKGGAILNLGSVESEAAVPLHATYAASKHAIKGLTDSIRLELAHSHTPVVLTLVRPSSTDTLFVEHARNVMPHAATLPAPTYAPEVVARAILHACVHPQRDVYIGNAKLMTRLTHNFPGLTDWVRQRLLYPRLTLNAPADRPCGALHNADVGTTRDARIHGGAPGPTLRHSLYDQAIRHPRVTTTAALVGGVALLGLLRRRR